MSYKRHLEISLHVFLMLLLLADGESKKNQKNSKSSPQQDLIRRMLKSYYKQDPPQADTATDVMLGMIVNSFYSINEGSMDYQVNFNLRQKWNDPRLKFPRNNFSDPSAKIKEIKLGNKQWEDIWLPDTFFRNEKKATFHQITVDNRMLRVNENGTVYYVTKISATFSCPMSLQSYPLDTQRCPITFESFGYTMDTMRFIWSDEKKIVDLGENHQLPQFTLVGFTRHECDQNYTAGRFPCLEVRFVLQRDIGFYLIQVYIPTILIVILSWVSFWINIESSPARVSIGLLTVLTMTTMSAGARASLPRVSYIKAIDVWMIICLIFVFTSLIEYAVVNVISRRKGPKAPVPAVTGPGAQGGAPNSTHAIGRNKKLCKCGAAVPRPVLGATGDTDGKRKARNIDKVSRQCFPIAFVLFNLVYWVVYVIPSESKDDDGPIET